MTGAQVLRLPFTQAPAAGHACEVAPGVRWLRIPLASALGGNHLNAWAVRDGPGWAIFDTGMHSDAAIAAWSALCAPDGALDGLPVTRVFCTHLHADHVGMAAWLCRASGCGLWMTRSEYLQCRMLAGLGDRPAAEAEREFHRRAGCDGAMLARLRPLGRNVPELPPRYRRIVHGEQIVIGAHAWRVVVGAGHSPEHACFHCPALGLLISGDQVLPRISSNVSVLPFEPQADPLREWMEALARIRREVPDDVCVLPAHGEPFFGLHARLERLADKRLQGLAQLRACLAEAPRRAVDTLGALFGREGFDDPFVQQLAVGEALAYLNRLLACGEALEREDRDGVAWYAPSPDIERSIRRHEDTVD